MSWLHRWHRCCCHVSFGTSISTCEPAHQGQAKTHYASKAAAMVPMAKIQSYWFMYGILGGPLVWV